MSVSYPGRHQRRTGIEQNHVQFRAGLAAQDRPHLKGRFRGGLAPLDGRKVSGLQAHLLRSQRRNSHFALMAVGYMRGRR